MKYDVGDIIKYKYTDDHLMIVEIADVVGDPKTYYKTCTLRDHLINFHLDSHLEISSVLIQKGKR